MLDRKRSESANARTCQTCLGGPARAKSLDAPGVTLTTP